MNKLILAMVTTLAASQVLAQAEPGPVTIGNYEKTQVCQSILSKYKKELGSVDVAQLQQCRTKGIYGQTESTVFASLKTHDGGILFCEASLGQDAAQNLKVDVDCELTYPKPGMGVGN